MPGAKPLQTAGSRHAPNAPGKPSYCRRWAVASMVGDEGTGGCNWPARHRAPSEATGPGSQGSRRTGELRLALLASREPHGG